MTSILDRMRQIKINKKYLLVGLVTSQVLAILLLTWFLTEPLTKRLLTTIPKNYSVTSMNPLKRYVVNQEDFISGKENPSQKIRVAILQGNSKVKQFKQDIITDPVNGSWNFQVPMLDPGKYTLAVGTLASSNIITQVKSYKIRIASNNLIYRSRPYQKLKSLMTTGNLTKGELIRETATLDENHTKIYSIGLKYNSQTGLITQLAPKIVPGKISALPAKRSSNPKITSYKVDTFSQDDILLNSGWLYFDSEELKKEYIIDIAVDYTPNSRVEIKDQNDKLIWVGFIK